ncbi:MAG: hypothetical protein ACR2G7_07000 [Acidimicrobiales bacterium]
MTVPRTALSPLVATAKSLAIDAVARELVPTPSFVRMWFPQVSRGRGGLVAGYGYRLVWIARHAPGGLRSWRRDRRAAVAGTDVRADPS